MVQLAKDIVLAAQVAHKNWKVPASVTLAQYGLESDWGKVVTGKFNYFGDKAVAGQACTMCTTHEVIKGKRVQIKAPFVNFTSVADAFDFHAKHLATSRYYGNAMAAGTAEEFAHALTGVYATDPDYGNKLVTIMRQSKLEQYD